MVKQNWMIIILCLAFGSPFLAITDLFPLHRFGMFAQMPESNNQIETYQIELKVFGKNWVPLKTGNTYMDESYLPFLAKKNIKHPESKKEFGKKIHLSLKEQPDSIKVTVSNGNKDNDFILFPL